MIDKSSLPPKVNPALFVWEGPMGLPEYGRFTDADFKPAFDYALTAHLKEVEEIANAEDAPTFENTIEKMELAGEAYSRVARIFLNLTGSHTNDAIQELERELAPRMAEHGSKISQNANLFARIDALWERRDELGLLPEAFRLLERRWKGFVKSGAKLSKAKQERLAEIDQRLAMLGTQFGQNVLKDEAEYALVLEETSDLEGLPDFLISAMAEAASEKGHEGKHAVTLSRSIIEPFLTFSARRDLREEAFKAWVSRGLSTERNNMPLVAEMVKLRTEKATLLGYKTYADLKLDDTMAKTPGAVDHLLKTVWEKAKAKSHKEVKALGELAVAEGANADIQPWDWRYYSEKLRAAKYDLDEAEVKAYFDLDRMVEAAFDTANRLFGLTFEEVSGIETFHPDVRVFEVKDAAGKQKAIFLGDYFARSSKRSGAWMSGLESQHKLAGGAVPIIMNTMNFAKAPKGQKVLLSLDDARTLFHEFGHALHGMLSDVTYPGMSGTSVSRDWVELPSQLFEHWLMQPEILKKFALHHETGEPIPDALLDKIKRAETFNSGFDNVEFTSSALVDMAFHTLSEEEAEKVDPVAFQAQELREIEMPDAIVMRHATPHFLHVFAGDGYSAGYYSYMWSGVLDSDAFKAFEEAGDPFDPVVANRLKTWVYSSGGSIDPEEAYKAFRGRLPTPDALLEKRGLV